MFLGEYQHTLDAKGRVILPARFRDQLEEGGVMAKAPDGCLAVYPMKEWDEVANRARELARQGAAARQAARSLFAGAAEVQPDRQGRVAIPPHLREFAHLDRDVVVAGVFSRIEVWDAEHWRQRNAQGEAVIAGEEELPEFGI